MNALQTVFDYHNRTKHHLQRYARALGYMDWATQPDPFRTYNGAEQLALVHPARWDEPSYDQLFSALPAQTIDHAAISRLIYDSLALSAWKQVAGSRPWSLRVNPSSGALHPTEGYLIAGPIAGLSDTAGVFHYAPYSHALERRRTLNRLQWATLTTDWPAECAFVALTSIYWRESWKYGERAFRYCHLDVGHAIGTVSLAAQMFGWQAWLIPADADDLALLLGVHTQHGVEAEHPDCLLAVVPGGSAVQSLPATFVSPDELRVLLKQAAPAGEPNRLSRSHHDWPIIDAVSSATREHLPAWPERSLRSPGAGSEAEASKMQPRPPELHLPDRGLPAERIIRERRSAVDMDGGTAISRDTFFRTLVRVVPALTPQPFSVLPGPPRLALALFVHRVADVPAGLYILVRDQRHEKDLRQRLDSRFVWKKPAGCPEALNLFLLAAGDARRYAKLTSCHQDIAADGAFAVAMLAEFEATLRSAGPAAYARLHWEAGLIGQVLYLEAEAAGIRATGIGCFFDDATHQLLGLTGHAWQTLYHFTTGGPVDDARLQTLEPYHHLRGRH
jgi:SagB-type dehydrogenase family enzyme